MVRQRKVRLGFIPANRGFFSDELAAKMRKQTLAVLKEAGAAVVVPSTKDTKVGCVETLDEAIKVGRMFREAQVEGIIVSAVNFGDEQGVALTIKESGLRVPILIVGCQEEEVLTPTTERRDSFCGLLSIGEALRQLGLAYSVPEVPICFPTDESFRGTVERFAAVCRVVGGIRKARYAHIGARPDAFWTCRYSEKALQELGPTIVSVDLSEIFAAVWAMPTNAAVTRVDSRLLGRRRRNRRQDRQVRARPQEVRVGKQDRRHGHPVLDEPPGQPGDLLVHDHGPLRRPGNPLRLRGRRHGHPVYARPPTRQRRPELPGRLEQPPQ